MLTISDVTCLECGNHVRSYTCTYTAEDDVSVRTEPCNHAVGVQITYNTGQIALERARPCPHCCTEHQCCRHCRASWPRILVQSAEAGALRDIAEYVTAVEGFSVMAEGGMEAWQQQLLDAIQQQLDARAHDLDMCWRCCAVRVPEDDVIGLCPSCKHDLQGAQ